MARVEIYFYRDEDGSLPLIRWLDTQPKKVQLKCIERINRLAEVGHELRRPEADYLRDVHYRVLYFFAGQAGVVLSHGITKEREVPSKEIDRAVKRKKQVEAHFKRHTFKPT